MPETQNQLIWDATAKIKFDKMIARIPLFHREIAKKVTIKKAELNAFERASKIVSEEDIVEAFLTEVPKAFYSLMMRLFDEVGFNYKKVASK